MRNTLKAGTVLGLLLLLAFQAGCASAPWPSVQLRPDEPLQREDIENADAVRVFTLAGTEVLLLRPEVTADTLLGRESRSAARRTRIPMDSIAAIQSGVRDRGVDWAPAVVLVVVIVALAVLLATVKLPTPDLGVQPSQ